MQSQHVGRIVRDNRRLDHGTIVYCPAFSQGDICNLAQVLGAAKEFDNPAAVGLGKFVSALADEGARLALAEVLVPEDLSHEGLTVPMFLKLQKSMSPKCKSGRSKLFRNLRYLPLKDFGKQLQYWAEHSGSIKSALSDK
ncbi:hypothetical protein [Halioglobus sp. HI00S01]|uniref:hypothetical protein n=1 Tax=Halioglobus sp. HI00S01 TaxID=1822214 RepID=UPI0012E8D267|nr:hypothetical protein [Halioglobus sp. HI00S01]